jgi:hypothetical protein
VRQVDEKDQCGCYRGSMAGDIVHSIYSLELRCSVAYPLALVAPWLLHLAI